MARWLAMHETITDAQARANVIESLRASRAIAKASGANFWAFESADESGRFLSFVEAGSREVVEDVLSSAGNANQSAALWHEVEEL